MKNQVPLSRGLVGGGWFVFDENAVKSFSWSEHLPMCLGENQIFIPVFTAGDDMLAILVATAAALSSLVVVYGYDSLAPGSGHTGLDTVDALLVGNAADTAI